jgi:hypothetical protein
MEVVVMKERSATYQKNLAEASTRLGGNVMWMIGQIMQKHDAAVIEASLEAIHSALAKEREEVARLVEQMGIEQYGTLAIAAAIRARSKNE